MICVRMAGTALRKPDGSAVGEKLKWCSGTI
jgi:hypothetical protein